MMIDREQVKYDIERCISHVPDACRDCSHYWGKKETDADFTAIDCMEKLLAEAYAMLKENDPVKPHYNSRTNWYECGACHYSMTSGMHCRSELIPATKVRYCANCGFPVNWEGW